LTTKWGRAFPRTSRIDYQYCHGLPKVLFVCSGHKPQYVYVFAATATFWGSFKALSAWTKQSRIARFTDTGGRVTTCIQRNTRFTDSWKRLYCEKVGILNYRQPVRKRDKDDLRTSRLTALLEFPAEDQYMHPHERAMALYSPSFGPRDRCFRCRALFKYQIGEGTPFDENEYGPLDCAEVLCNNLCNLLPPAIAVKPPAVPTVALYYATGAVVIGARLTLGAWRFALGY
jgi:hypothetical protein